MKKIPNIAIFGLISWLLGFALFVQTSQAQVAPSVRYLSIETKSGSTFTVVWSLFEVAEWADQVHFKLWVVRGSDPCLLSHWGIGLSKTFGFQGGFQNSSEMQMDHIMAEFPFGNEQRTHPIDGLQTYYFFRSHLIFSFNFEEDDILFLAADYENEPEYYGGELPYYGPYNTGDYCKIEYGNILDSGIYPSNVIPEIQFGTVAASISMVIALAVYMRKLKQKR